MDNGFYAALELSGVLSALARQANRNLEIRDNVVERLKSDVRDASQHIETSH